MDTLLGIDVGTTATKSVLLTPDGDVLAEGSHGYGVTRIGEEGYEQDPEDFWNGVVHTTRQVLSAAQGAEVRGLALSTQAGTVIPVDGHGRPLCGAITWMDHRGAPYLGRVHAELSADAFYRIAGWELGAHSTIVQLIRLSCEEPEIVRRAKRYLFVNDYLHERLTGRPVMDPSNAGITGLFNVREKDWEGRFLAIAGIAEDALSEMEPSGSTIGGLREEAAGELGLATGTPVVNGAHDQYCAALGAGVMEEGDVLVSSGTAWVVLGVFRDLERAFATGVAVSVYPLVEKWGALGSAGAVGKGISWFAETILKPLGVDKPYRWMEKTVGTTEAGSRGLLFMTPARQRSPGMMSGFLNLKIDHTPADLARAVMEGITLEVRRVAGPLAGGAAAGGRIIMVGRPAENRVWPQIVADVFDMPVVVPGHTQMAARGAALLAGAGVGVRPGIARDVPEENERSYEPDAGHVDAYAGMYGRYRDIVDRNEDQACSSDG